MHVGRYDRAVDAGRALLEIGFGVVTDVGVRRNPPAHDIRKGRARAPEALLKLGVSLNGLGARARACAVYAEIVRKYPQASAQVRQGLEREQKRAKCA